MVLAPLALLFFLLWIANRRAKAQLEAREGTEAPDREPDEAAREPRE